MDFRFGCISKLIGSQNSEVFPIDGKSDYGNQIDVGR